LDNAVISRRRITPAEIQIAVIVSPAAEHFHADWEQELLDPSVADVIGETRKP
jgi:hypothetical protein